MSASMRALMSSRMTRTESMPWPAGSSSFQSLVALAREVGAGVAASHGDDDVGFLDSFGGEDLGLGAGDVDADLSHRVDRDGVDLVGGFGSCGEDLDTVASEVLEESCGHLGASGVVDADEQDGGLVGHGVLSLFRFRGHEEES
jgi:hypothetical protein